MKKIKLIYNSGAGQSKFKYFLDPIIEKFMQNDFAVTVFRADTNTNLYEFLKDSNDEDLYGIVVAGGDGTINRVVNIMMREGINVPMGVIPAGTSNDFAKHINMPQNFVECIDKILTGNVQEIDVGLANDKYFINICSAGIFTSAPQKTDMNLKNAIGKLSYFITGVEQVFEFRPFSVRIETEKDIIIENVMLFLIFNGSSCGGMDKFTDGASIQDGLLDVVIIKECSFAEASVLLPKVLTGNHFEDKNVIYLKEKWLKINKTKGKVDDPDVDGESGLKFPLEVKCIEKGLKMFL